MKRSVFRNTLVLVVSVVLVVAMAEVAIRFAWHMSGWVERPIYQRSPDPYLRYELAPGVRWARVSVNSDGFRGQEYPVEKEQGVFRIAMLGDSETLSIRLDQQDTLSSQLESILNRQSSSLRYEVLNFGVEGYGTLQELEMLKKKAIKYDPDLIILNYVLNDPDAGEYYFNKTFLMRHSILARYFTYRIKKGLIRRERKQKGIHTEVDEFYYLHQPKYFRWIKDAILQMAGIAGKRGSKLAVVIFPVSSIEVEDFRERYPYKSLHELVKGIKSEGIVFIDLIDEFNRLGLTPQEVSIDYKANESHKNAAALKAAADYIYEVLKANQLVLEEKEEKDAEGKNTDN